MQLHWKMKTKHEDRICNYEYFYAIFTDCINSGSLQQFIMSWTMRNTRLPCNWANSKFYILCLCTRIRKMAQHKPFIYFLCQWAAIINYHQCASGVQQKPTCINPWNSCNIVLRIEKRMAIYVKWHNRYRKRSQCTDHNLSI